MPQPVFLTALAVFLGCLLALGYTYAGYPLLVHLLARLRPRPVRRAPFEPSVSFIIAAYNEEKDIARKLENTLELDYPADRLEIVVASDGSTDRTEEIVRTYEDRGVRLFVPEAHRGKTGTANEVVPTTRGEILVFSDATGLYNPESVRAMASNFADSRVGAVTGRVAYSYGESATARGFELYQRYVVPQRQAESRFGTETSVSGSIHAIRRELFVPAPPELSYDMVHPLHVAQAGKRSVYEAEAVSLEEARSEAADEFRSRVRIAVRAFSFVPYLLRGLPRCRDSTFVFQVISHKLLRWMSPVFLALAFLAAAVLALRGGAWLLPLAASLAGLAAAGLGWLASRWGRPGRLVAAPLFFVTINLAYLVGLFRYLRGARLAGWGTAR